MPVDSTDIMFDNMIKRYSKRPPKIESYCLADYVSQLGVTYPKRNCEYEFEDENNDEKMMKYQMMNVSMKIKLF